MPPGGPHCATHSASDAHFSFCHLLLNQDAAAAKAATAAAAVTALVAASPAVAATEVATLAAGDGRLGILLGLFVPALGWVAFNMAQVCVCVCV